MTFRFGAAFWVSLSNRPLVIILSHMLKGAIVAALLYGVNLMQLRTFPHYYQIY